MLRHRQPLSIAGTLLVALTLGASVLQSPQPPPTHSPTPSTPPTYCVFAAEAGTVVLVRVHAAVHAVFAAHWGRTLHLRQHLLAKGAAAQREGGKAAASEATSVGQMALNSPRPKSDAAIISTPEPPPCCFCLPTSPHPAAAALTVHPGRAPSPARSCASRRWPAAATSCCSRRQTPLFGRRALW